MDEPQEKISVVGYGSLISETSARQTAPTLSNFKLGKVHGYKRIFNKAGIVFFRRGSVRSDDISVASCATRSDPRYAIGCCVFDCTEEDFTKIYEREHRFRWIEVDVETEDGVVKGRMCTEYNDADYLLNKCVLPSAYFERVGQYYDKKIWRDDILPHKQYLAFCLGAVSSVSDDMKDNFLDTTFLADGETSIRTFLDDNPDYLAGVSAEHSYKKS